MENTATTKELTQGFKPDNKAKKLLSNYFDTCAYVYPDGVIIREKKTLKQGKYSKQIEVNHVYKCGIKLYRTNYKDQDDRPITRIVCHDTTTLLDGVKQFNYYANNCSTAMEKQGLSCNSLTLITLNGARHRADDWPDLLGSAYTVQFDNEYTIEKVIETEKQYDAIIEYHD
jgi:hypothetical protein